jgi:hypothetical protein
MILAPYCIFVGAALVAMSPVLALLEHGVLLSSQLELVFIAAAAAA